MPSWFQINSIREGGPLPTAPTTGGARPSRPPVTEQGLPDKALPSGPDTLYDDARSGPNLGGVNTWPGSTTTTTTPAATAPGSGFSWARWDELTSQYPGTVAGLQQLVKDHPELGVTIVGGSQGDIQLPDGQVWDVMNSAGLGGKGWQRLQDTGGGQGPTSMAGLGAFGSALAPWDQQFSHAKFQPPPRFQAPDAKQVFDDQGFQFRLNEGQKALERSAASKGTLLTGGTAKALQRFGQDMASQEYGNVYNRRLGEHQMLYGQTANEWQTDYNKAMGEYNLGREQFYQNQDRPFNKLTSLAGLGQVNSPSYAGTYGNLAMGGAGNIGNYWTQAANANAAGGVGGANAWNQAFGNIGNSFMDLGMYYANQNRNSSYAG